MTNELREGEMSSKASCAEMVISPAEASTITEPAMTKPGGFLFASLLVLSMMWAPEGHADASVYGRVWGPTNTPAGGAYVFVSDEAVEKLYAEAITRLKTDATSPAGSYSVKGLPANTRVKIFAFHSKIPSAFAYAELVLKEGENRKVILDITMDIQSTGMIGNPLLRIPTLLKQAERFQAADAVIARLSRLESAPSSTGGLPEPEVPTEGLVAYYPLDGNARDKSGNGNAGTINNASFAPGRFGGVTGALYCDGQSGEVRIEDDRVFGLKDFTLSAWIRTSSPNGLVLTKDIYGSGDDFNFGVVEGRLRVELFSSVDGQVTGSSRLDDNSWHLVAATRRGGTVRMFVDGELDGQGQVTTSGIRAAGVPLQIGGAWEPAWYFSGYIDNVRIYNRALSESEVMALYREGTD